MHPQSTPPPGLLLSVLPSLSAAQGRSRGWRGSGARPEASCGVKTLSTKPATAGFRQPERRGIGGSGTPLGGAHFKGLRVLNPAGQNRPRRAGEQGCGGVDHRPWRGLPAPPTPSRSAQAPSHRSGRASLRTPPTLRGPSPATHPASGASTPAERNGHRLLTCGRPALGGAARRRGAGPGSEPSSPAPRGAPVRSRRAVRRKGGHAPCSSRPLGVTTPPNLHAPPPAPLMEKERYLHS